MDENGFIGYGWIYFVYLIGVVVGVVNFKFLDDLNFIENVGEVGVYFNVVMVDVLKDYLNVGDI